MPRYPTPARKKSLRGKVISEVLIDRAGNVVKTCSQGQPLLAKAVDDALRQWKFLKNFGMASQTPERGPQFAVVRLIFEFSSDSPESRLTTSNKGGK